MNDEKLLKYLTCTFEFYLPRCWLFMLGISLYGLPGEFGPNFND